MPMDNAFINQGNNAGMGPMNNASIGNNQEVLNDVPPTSNKFFNPLEDTPVTMDNLNPFAADANFSIDQAPAQDSEVEVFDMPSNPNVINQSNPVESLNPMDSSVQQPFNNPQPMTMDSMNQNTMTDNIMSSPINMNNNNAPQGVSQTLNELNPNNKFFQPVQEQSVSNPMMDTNVLSTPVNPMDNVSNLMDNNIQNPLSTPQEAPSLGDAINDVRGLVEQLNIRGLNVTIDEADLQTSYQMNISIMK